MSTQAPSSPQRRTRKAPSSPSPKPHLLWVGLLNLWSNIEANLLTAFVALVFFACIGLAIFNQKQRPLTLELPIPVGLPVVSNVSVNASPSGPVQILGLVNGRLLVSNNSNLTAIDLPVALQPILATMPASAPYGLSGPVWSPDGTSTAFLSKRDGVMRLFIGAPNGVRALTPRQLPNSLALNEQTWIAWAPDAKHIALTIQSADALFAQMLVVATDKEEVIFITNDARTTYSPLWLDSQNLVFVSADANGNAQIILTDSNGANPQVVFKTP